MKTKKIFFRVGALVFLLIVSAIMMVIGRGHSVYLDNAPLDYNGQTYPAAYKMAVFIKDEQVAKLYDKKRENRGMATCIGQKFSATLEITKEKGGKEERVDISLPLPYGMDGIAINLPAYLAGLPAEVYLSEFQIIPTETEDPTEAPVDEFAIPEPILPEPAA